MIKKQNCNVDILPLPSDRRVIYCQRLCYFLCYIAAAVLSGLVCELSETTRYV